MGVGWGGGRTMGGVIKGKRGMGRGGEKKRVGGEEKRGKWGCRQRRGGEGGTIPLQIRVHRIDKSQTKRIEWIILISLPAFSHSISNARILGSHNSNMSFCQCTVQDSVPCSVRTTYQEPTRRSRSMETLIL